MCQYNDYFGLLQALSISNFFLSIGASLAGFYFKGNFKPSLFFNKFWSGWPKLNDCKIHLNVNLFISIKFMKNEKKIFYWWSSGTHTYSISVNDYNLIFLVLAIFSEKNLKNLRSRPFKWKATVMKYFKL